MSVLRRPKGEDKVPVFGQTVYVDAKLDSDLSHAALTFYLWSEQCARMVVCV